MERSEGESFFARPISFIAQPGQATKVMVRLPGTDWVQGYFLVSSVRATTPECDVKITTATLMVMQRVELGRTKLDLETGKKWKSRSFQTSRRRRSSSSAANFFW